MQTVHHLSKNVAKIKYNITKSHDLKHKATKVQMKIDTLRRNYEQSKYVEQILHEKINHIINDNKEILEKYYVNDESHEAISYITQLEYSMYKRIVTENDILLYIEKLKKEYVNIVYQINETHKNMKELVDENKIPCEQANIPFPIDDYIICINGTYLQI